MPSPDDLEPAQRRRHDYALIKGFEFIEEVGSPELQATLQECYSVAAHDPDKDHTRYEFRAEVEGGDEDLVDIYYVGAHVCTVYRRWLETGEGESAPDEQPWD